MNEREVETRQMEQSSGCKYKFSLESHPTLLNCAIESSTTVTKQVIILSVIKEYKPSVSKS